MSLEDAEKIDPDATWAIAETHEQKSADMLRVACLSSADEDVNTLWTLQRAFGTNDNDKLAALHQIDVFASEEVASQVQEQRAAAMASCDEVPMHIVSSSKISNLADDVLQITVALEDDPADLHTLVLARTGSAITMVDVVRNSKAVGVEAVTDAVVRSLSEFCEAVDGTCPDGPEVKKSIPPPTEPEGWLQTADFPRITAGAGLWTATEPTKLDSKGMGCEDMTLSSASDAQEREQRTYLLTQDDNTPSTFGVDEMIFTFDKADDAKSFADKLGGNLANCKDKLLNAKVSADSKFDGKGADDVEFNGRTMTIKLDTSSDDAVLYQLAVSRVDKQVSYLLTSVTDDYKFDEAKQFQALAQRAAQRQSQNQ